VAKGRKYGGRIKGTPNRSTANARQAIADFIDGNSHRLQEWLDEVAAKDGPKAAITCFISLLEFHVPKLARQEVSAAGENGLKLTINLSDDKTHP
jgi:hypothetical protein